MAPLLAGGQSQGEARRQVAGPVEGRTASRSQQQLEQLAVVEAGRAVAGRQVGMAGGAETVAVGVGQALHLPHRAQRAEQGPEIRVSPRASSGERRYKSSSSTARVGSLNSWQP